MLGGLDEFVRMFEGMSLQLPFATRVLLALGRLGGMFVSGVVLVVVALSALAWRRPGTVALELLQALLFFFACFVLMGIYQPLLQILENLA